jgi:hypothetical protein
MALVDGHDGGVVACRLGPESDSRDAGFGNDVKRELEVEIGDDEGDGRRIVSVD